MKLLVDSCVWSLALRRRKGPDALTSVEARLVAALADAIRDGRVLLAGPIRQEILSGIRSAQQFETLRAHLEVFPDLRLSSADYVQAARLFNLCRAVGQQCGPVDMLLCAIACGHRCTVLTHDAGLLRCLRIIEDALRSSGELPGDQRLVEEI